MLNNYIWLPLKPKYRGKFSSCKPLFLADIWPLFLFKTTNCKAPLQFYYFNSRLINFI
ncbi:hypothetical protein PTRA_b0056 [Pseudoalteromonas translucida KMM 520]|uniref:Uncharacterized protein n=1 Tax=Pseudoalteromonas translucida KMM 520 TaxID=1315283 RepID=A0A0U2NK82_9GAMM|nr:hypothetical protein PTRA_b0056 [Pseudoalteromonas translucida KMM 520]